MMTHDLPENVPPLALASPEEIAEYRSILRAAREAAIRARGRWGESDIGVGAARPVARSNPDP